ncbi:MAG: DUF1559 domain-containing protein [Thermoguttaceae bacterium]
MDSRTKKRGFTRIALLVVVAIIAILLAVLVVAVQRRREEARRTQCIDNMKTIGIAMHNFHSTQQHFPGSGQVTSTGGGAVTVGGWNFLVLLVPYIEMSGTYYPFQINAQVATATSIPTYVCPSNPNSKYQDPGDSPPQFALTNYKGMGATCMASLNMMTQPNGTPPYGKSDMHPDGAMYPGNGVRIGDITDGTAHTIMCVETIDDTQSVWTLGTDATLVGLPYQGDPGSTKPTGAIQSFTNQTAQGNTVAFYMPAGFTGSFDEEGKMAGTPGPGYSQYRTYLSFDFGPTGADKGTYPLFNTNNRTVSGLPGGSGAKYTMGANGDGPQSNQPAYGPSSGHSAVVNHLFADGSVHSLSRQIDVSAYMFLITKNGGDPNPPIP